MILRYPPRRVRACGAPRRFSAGPGGLARIDGGLSLWQSNHSTANSRANVCPHGSASSRCLEEFLRWRDFGADTSLRPFSRHPRITEGSKRVGRTFTGLRPMEPLKDQTLSGEKNDDLARAITRVGRCIRELSGLGLGVDDHDYFVLPDLSRSLLRKPCRAPAFSRSNKRTNSSSA